MSSGNTSLLAAIQASARVVPTLDYMFTKPSLPSQLRGISGSLWEWLIYPGVGVGVAVAVGVAVGAFMLATLTDGEKVAPTSLWARTLK